MKPTFALDLTSDSIALLHRAPKGWLGIGEVAFDAPDLTEALDYLRKTALGLSPMGIATKLVIPNGQILYTEVTAPGPSREDKRKQILAGLEGRTPYAVEDLVFDWSGKGATVKVAVVARETLAEAEAFAAEHRFNPVSFVAIPEPGSFVGEPWFGPTEVSDTILAPGEAVDRDRDAIVMLHRELPKSEAAVETPAETPSEAPVAAPAGDDAEDLLPGLAEALSAVLPPAIEPAPQPELVEAGPAVPVDDDLELEAALAAEDVADDVPHEATHAAEAEEAPFAHVTDTGLFPDAEDDRPPQPFGKAAAPVEDDDELPPAPSSAAMVAFASRRAATSADAAVRAPETLGRPVGKPVEELPPLPRPTAPPAPPPLPPGLHRNGTAKDLSGLAPAPAIPGSRKSKTKGIPAANPNRPGMPGAKTLTKPGGTFGARPQQGRPRFLGLILTGLLLVFLAILAAWSSFYMASVDPSMDGTATVEATLPDIEDEMLADMQDPETGLQPMPEADVTVAEVVADAEIAPEADATLVTIVSEEAAPAAQEPAPAEPAAPEPAEPALAEVEPAKPLPAAPEVAATGAPAAVPAPAAEVEDVVAAPVPEPAPDTAVPTEVSTVAQMAEDQDEIFLAAMDVPPPALDALALPPPEARGDTLPDAPMPPPVFGTVYRFDANGLLLPTPEGILSPEGVMLIAGKPPLLPPSRSEVASAAALAASALSAPVAGPTPPADSAATDAPMPPPDPALQGFRPLPRPEGLVPAAAAPDDAALDAANAAFAGLRPLPRPALVLAAAAAARPAAVDLGAQGASLTAQNEATLAAAAVAEAENPSVVAISRRPAARPRDLSRAVEAAVAAAVREPEPEAVASAAPAPDLNPEEQDEGDEPEVASAAPKIPTRASVAKQATFVNAINLSKTNLIGVYGTQSKRYALIRQSNGRYKKVKVGDRIDGGTIQAITDNEVRYQKGGKLVALRMPKA